MANDRGGRKETRTATTLRDALGDRMRALRDDIPEAARGAIDDGMDLYRRGAMAVTRTAGDNGALMLLAGGAAVAGLSWLVLRRRRRGGDEA